MVAKMVALMVVHWAAKKAVDWVARKADLTAGRSAATRAEWRAVPTAGKKVGLMVTMTVALTVVRWVEQMAVR